MYHCTYITEALYLAYNIPHKKAVVFNKYMNIENLYSILIIVYSIGVVVLHLSRQNITFLV
jgi:hypothetical protein